MTSFYFVLLSDVKRVYVLLSLINRMRKAVTHCCNQKNKLKWYFQFFFNLVLYKLHENDSFLNNILKITSNATDSSNADTAFP